MLVVSDASPINILIRIGHVEVLGSLFRRVVVPPVVVSEMSHPSTPQKVREWIARPPSWFEVRAPAFVDPTIDLDMGEREAICLVRELHADYLLVDDRAARKTAVSLGIPVTGTLGVLESAAARNLLTLADAFQKLRLTDFRISEELLDQSLRRNAERS